MSKMKIQMLPIFLYLATMVFIAWRISKRTTANKNKDFIEEYFMGGRNMSGIVLAMTMVGAYVGASSFIAGPGVAYKLGLGWVLLACIQIPTVFFTLGILGKKLAIISRKIGSVTISDYLRARYQNETVVIIASTALVIFSIGAIVVQFIGGARLFESVLGVPYYYGLIFFTVIVTIFTVIGGFRAVAVTDAIQGFIMIIATFILFISVLKAGGGMSNITQKIMTINPELLTPTSGGNIAKPFILSFWILVGIGLLGLPSTTVNCMGFKNTKSLHRAMIIGTIVVGILMIGMHLIGFMGSAILPDIKIGDTAIPLLSLATLHPILAGVFIAGPLAAIMSTVDSLLIQSSATIIKDLYVRHILKGAEPTNKKINIISKSASAFLGIVVFIFAMNPPDLLVTINLLFLAGQESIFFCPILFGLYYKRANATGALASMIIGLGSFLFLHVTKINILGLHNIVPVLSLSVIAFFVGSHFGKKPNEQVMKIFFE